MNVRSGSEADIASGWGHVRLTPESRPKSDVMACPPSAMTGSDGPSFDRLIGETRPMHDHFACSV
jgi:hypothetical protein